MRAVITSALLLCVCHATPASAEILERDWKAPGDGLLTYDTVNKREWLDLTESIRSQFGGFTGEENLDNAVAQLEPGGLFEGFTWASAEDVRGFALSAGIDITTQDYDINAEPVMNVLDMLGSTVETAPQITVGFVNTPQVVVFEYGTVGISYARMVIGEGAGGLSRPAHSGLMLYRKAIPEPSANVLAAAGALGLLVRGCARKKPRRLTRWRIRAPRMLLAFLLTAALATPASAEILQRDWKAPGDGLLTYDTVNKREWLDLTENIPREIWLRTNFGDWLSNRTLPNQTAEAVLCCKLPGRFRRSGRAIVRLQLVNSAQAKWKLLALGGKPVESFEIESDPNEPQKVLDNHPALVASMTVQRGDGPNVRH